MLGIIQVNLDASDGGRLSLNLGRGSNGGGWSCALGIGVGSLTIDHDSIQRRFKYFQGEDIPDW